MNESVLSVVEVKSFCWLYRKFMDEPIKISSMAPNLN